MRSRRRIAALVALTLMAAPGQVMAQGASPAVKPSAAQKQAAVFNLRVLIGALQSDKVDNQAKAALIGCLYDNSLRKISDAVDKVIAANPGKINRTNPDQILSVIVGVCGYRPAPSARKK